MFKRVIGITVLAALFQLASSPVLAASKYAMLQECVDGELSEDDSTAMLAELRQWGPIPGTIFQKRAAECYQNITGEVAIYVENRGLIYGEEAQTLFGQQFEKAKAKAEAVLLQPTVREDLKCSLLEDWNALRSKKAAADQIINADAVLEDRRRNEAYNATYNACRDWYGSDSTKALTSAVCSPLFLEYGLPDSGIAGPTRDEVLAAQSASTGASLDITLIDIRLRSVQIDEKYVAEYSEEALYDLKKEVEDEREAQAALPAPSNEEPLSACEVLWLKWQSEN